MRKLRSVLLQHFFIRLETRVDCKLQEELLVCLFSVAWKLDWPNTFNIVGLTLGFCHIRKIGLW